MALGLKPSECIRITRSEASVRAAAREILNQLNKWHGPEREVAEAKWVWELIQNARDVAKKQNKESFEVKFVLNKNQLLFEHNAGPFSISNIDALLKGQTDKPMESPEIIGQFGKGFLITHILSGKVNVSGWLIDDKYHINKTFKMSLDRSFQANDILTVEHIAKNIEDCERQLDDPHGPPLRDDVTEFEYLLDEESRETVINGVKSLEETLPFVLAFIKPKITVRIIREGRGTVYKVISSEIIQSEPIRIEQMTMNNQELWQGDSLIVASYFDSHVKIAVPYSSSTRNLLRLGDRPRLFRMYPLAKTGDLVLPIVIDGPFRVSAERFDVGYRDNQIAEFQKILREVSSLLRYLCKWSLDNDIRCKEILLEIGAPLKGRPYEEQWFQELSFLVKEVSQMEAVEAMVDATREKTGLLKPEFVHFPSPLVGSDSFEDQKFIRAIWLLSRYLCLKVPKENLVKEWNKIRTLWKSLGVTTGNEETFEKLVEQIQELKSFTNLQKKPPLNTDRNSLDFLTQFYKLGNYYRSRKEQTPKFLMNAIYCNQKGDFKRPDELYTDQDIPDALKKISDDIFESLYERLLKPEFSKDSDLKEHFQALGFEIMDEKKAIDELYKSIRLNWKEKTRPWKVDANKYKKGVMEFEKWLLQNENFESLIERNYPLRELPFLFEDNELRPVEKEYLVLPEGFLENEEREHMSIWPNDTKLSKGYSEGITDPTLIRERLVAAKLSQPRLFFREETELLTDQIREMRDTPIKGSYSTTTTISKVIAFDKVLAFAEKSCNPELSKGILNFVLGYLVPHDDSWQELATVEVKELSRNSYGRPVPRGKERNFEIYPCLWFSQMKKSKWVITTSKDEEEQQSFSAEQPSKDNLTEYVKILQPSILSDERIQTFLQKKFEFSPLEMTGWLLTCGNSEAEQALIGNLKQIHELASSQGLDPMIILNEMSSEMERKSHQIQITRRNQNFGLIIERAVGKVFELMRIKEYGFEVCKRWEGYDYDVYLQRKCIEESDFGTLRIEVQMPQTKEILRRFQVEAKATKIDTVAMTLTQANYAVDLAETYLLCVVDASTLSADLADLESPSLNDEQIERLSEKIITQMKIVKIGEDLKQVINNFQKAGSAAQDIKVVYSDVRFTISSKIWITKGETFVNWFNSVLHELGVSTD